MDDQLRQALRHIPCLDEADISPITVGQSGSRVCRLHLRGGRTAILKITEPRLMPDYLTAGYPCIADTEYNFYTQLVPSLGLPCPQLFAHGRLTGGASFLVLQDLAPECFIPSEGHIWATEELMAIVTTYGQMHGRAQRFFAKEGVPTWLNPDPRLGYSPEQTKQHLKELSANSWTRALAAPIVTAPNFDAVLDRLQTSLAHIPATLLFNDFYPPNVALPTEQGAAAILFDYQLIGSGPGHIDIVNIGFLGKDIAFGKVDREAVLAQYLYVLGQETGETLSPVDFHRDYYYANLLAWADFLPRFVRAMRRSNATNEHWGEWMEKMFAVCMAEWAEALSK